MFFYLAGNFLLSLSLTFSFSSLLLSENALIVFLVAFFESNIMAHVESEREEILGKILSNNELAETHFLLSFWIFHQLSNTKH